METISGCAAVRFRHVERDRPHASMLGTVTNSPGVLAQMSKKVLP